MAQLTQNQIDVWIKSPDGNLINLAFVASVTISKKDDTKVLIKYPVAAGINSVDVITCADNATALALVAKIEAAVTDAYRFVDLS